MMKKNCSIIIILILIAGYVNAQDFEFRGFKWNTLKDDVINKEGIPKEEIDGYIFYRDITNTRETSIKYYNKYILSNIKVNSLEYIFIDNKLLRTQYSINLLNKDDIINNFDGTKITYKFINRKNMIEMFFRIKNELKVLYVLTYENDSEENYYKNNVDKLNFSSFSPGLESRFSHRNSGTIIEIRLWQMSRDNNFWISIDYESPSYSSLHRLLYDNDKNKWEKENSGGL
jgi:hypothetical protein